MDKGCVLTLDNRKEFFRIKEVMAWSLKYCDCGVCVEKHSRNPRYLLARLLSGKRKYNLEVCQRQYDIPQVENKGSGSPYQAKKKKLC